MITKAIVVQIVPPNKFKVRVPIFDGPSGAQNSIPDEYLNDATLCTLPNVDNVINVGDIVYVAFEDNDAGRPVILGHLYMGENSTTNTKIDLNARTIKALGSNISKVELPNNTKIGDITYSDLYDMYKFWKSFPKYSFDLSKSPWYSSDYVDITSQEEPNTNEPINNPTVWHNALNENGEFIEITSEQIPNDNIISFNSNLIIRMSNLATALDTNASHFNCYAYAINNYVGTADVDDQDQWLIGAFSGPYDTSPNSTREYTNRILRDLTSTEKASETSPEPLNKKNVMWTTDVPDITALEDNEHLFAFRVGFSESGVHISDYHFVRYDKSSGWTHKMEGSPSILKIKDEFALPGNVILKDGTQAWPSELCFATELANDSSFVFMTTGEVDKTKMIIRPNLIYAGQIIYFKYTDE